MREIELWTADGVRLAARFYPSSDPAVSRRACVVVHGFTGSSRQPDVVRICTALSARGFAVVSPDSRGHGGSAGRSTAGAEEIHDAAAAVAWLREEHYDRIATLGWSMGGTTVLRHAGLGGDSDAVVSVSAAGTWWERGTRAMRLVHWMFESRTGRLATRVLRSTRVSAEGWDPVPDAPADVVGGIAPRPLLVVHGEADHYFPMTHVEALAEAAPGAEVWREAGMGHAEAATGADLLERIGTWLHAVLDAGADADADADADVIEGVEPDAAVAPVCHDGRRVDRAAGNADSADGGPGD